MIVEEFFEISGISHVRHYSDRGVKIADENGEEYDSAEDLTALGMVYHETETPASTDDSTIADKAEAYDILIGGAE